MTTNCANCDRITPDTDAGMCDRCRGELRFVVRPAAHREAYRRRSAEQAGAIAELERPGLVVISSLPADNALWLCDLCNSQIEVEGEHTLIPLLGDHALCWDCVTQLPYWPNAWTEPAPRACRCGACQRPLLSALARL